MNFSCKVCEKSEIGGCQCDCCVALANQLGMCKTCLDDRTCACCGSEMPYQPEGYWRLCTRCDTNGYMLSAKLAQLKANE